MVEGSQLESQMIYTLKSKLSSKAVQTEHLFSRALLLLKNLFSIRVSEPNIHFKNVGTDIETVDLMAYQRYYNLAGK